MANNKYNLCYICAVVHLLLLNLSPIAPNSLIYSFLYVLSYALPAFILLLAFPVKAIKLPRVGISDIFIFFPVMLITSYALTTFFGSASEAYSLTPSTFLMMAIIAPLCEELFWRGGVFRVLKRFGFIPAALVSSLLFALMHRGVGGIIYAILSGMIFSYLTFSTGSTLSAIILHVANNTVALLLTSDQIITLIIIPVSLVLGIILKVLFPSRQITEKKAQAFRGAFKMPYLYITVAVFVIFRLLEAYLG